MVLSVIFDRILYIEPTISSILLVNFSRTVGLSEGHMFSIDQGSIFEKKRHMETYEKCSILVKVKPKIPDFERGKAMILTTEIY